MEARTLLPDFTFPVTFAATLVAQWKNTDINQDKQYIFITITDTICCAGRICYQH